ncbi:hypothetical protein AB7M17_001427 [Bradyrhizobium sp. USDA 377]
MNSRLASGFSRSWALIRPSERRHVAHRIRMEGEVVLLRQAEDADQIDRIVLEHVGRGDVDAVVVDDEVVAVGHAPFHRRRAQARHHPAQHRRGLGLLVLELGAENGGEVADLFGDQEVVLHEALDVLHAGMRGVAEPDRDLALEVEGQALLGAVAVEVQVAAHRPEEVGAASERAVFLRVEHAALDQLVGVAHAVDVFGDPEQRVQVAQRPLAVLDVGLDQIARLAAAAVPLLALGELCRDEFGRGALYHFLVEALDQLVIERLVAGEEACLQDRGADGHVAARLPDRFIDRARGVTDLQPHVPEAIEDGFGDLLAPGGLLVGQDEEQIDVRLGRHQAAAVAAGRHHRHPLGAAGNRRAVEMTRRRRIEDADDLVLHVAEPLGAAAAVTVLQEDLLRRRACRDQLGLEQLRDRSAERVLAALMLFGKRIDRGGDPRGVEAIVHLRLLLSCDAVHVSPDIRGDRRCHPSFAGNSRSVLERAGFGQICSRPAPFQGSDFLVDL